ncbi:MAG: lactate racemase domain-containing protein [Verrucomicrobia bacterium]|nr:lactate racemase domain-containing protein [Verrucomicrobiota bacterium]
MCSVQAIAPPSSSLSAGQIPPLVEEACAGYDWDGKKVLVIVPDATRTAPVGQVFRALHATVAGRCRAFDVMVALGTHPPMSEEAICGRLEISAAEKHSAFSAVNLFNHEWDNPEALACLGSIPAKEIGDLSGGLFSMDVSVSINRRLLDYDRLIIIGPVFPHEVVGCSGGNKYLFPGVAGPDILNFFHWLGAVITNPMIIGNKWTPVRRVVDRAAALVPVEKLCFCLVVQGGGLAGIFAGTPEAAWDAASDLSQELHIVRKPKPFHTVLSCAPKMYDELWVGGKCMYKLEPVVADGGELIIYAPHIHEVSVVHGHVLRRIGYHCRDYFLKQWDRFKDLPWGTLAHSTHVRGIGKFEDGIEQCRIRVTLATGIPEDICREINLCYRDPASIDVESFANREDEGILLVRKAGEMLYHLDDRPDWAKEA